MKYNKLIVEGCDGVGKSTFIRALQKRLIEETGHAWTVLKQDPKGGCPERARKTFETLPSFSIMDRSDYPSEMIYKKVLGDPLTWDKILEFHNLSPLIRDLGISYIWLQAPKGITKRRLEQRGDDEHLIKHLKRIHLAYAKFFFDTYLPWITLNTKDNVNTLVLSAMFQLGVIKEARGEYLC